MAYSMRSLRFVLPLLLLCLPMLAVAQDVIYLKDGRTLEVHVKKITSGLIYYSKPGAPMRSVNKSKAEKIVYERGREVVFKDSRNKQTAGEANNVLTIAPLNILVFGKLTGLGIGLDYERFIGERHLISIHVPFYLGIAVTNTGDGTNQNIPYDKAETYYTAPGIRFHWLKPEGKVDLASGVSVVFGNVNTSSAYPVVSGGSQRPEFNVQNFLFTAITLDNDFTLITKRKIAFGVHTAFGPILGDYGKDGKWMVQIGLKLGRKF